MSAARSTYREVMTVGGHYFRAGNDDVYVPTMAEGAMMGLKYGKLRLRSSAEMSGAVAVRRRR